MKLANLRSRPWLSDDYIRHQISHWRRFRHPIRLVRCLDSFFPIRVVGNAMEDRASTAQIEINYIFASYHRAEAKHKTKKRTFNLEIIKHDKYRNGQQYVQYSRSQSIYISTFSQQSQLTTNYLISSVAHLFSLPLKKHFLWKWASFTLQD